MNALLKSIWTDIVEKRLWPIGAALLVALVAVPILLSSSGSSDNGPVAGGYGSATSTDASPTSTTPLATDHPALQLLTASERHPARSTRDPFTQIKVAKPASAKTQTQAQTESPTPTTTEQVTPAPSATITSPLTSTDPTSTTKTTPKKATPPANNPALFRVNLRVGQSGDLHTHDNVERLSPLPSTDDPFLVFMGVMKDGKTAVFLLSSDVKATGSGVCHPSATNCQSVEMKSQDIEFFDVASDNPADAPLQYELDLGKIVKTSAATGATSARAARVSTRTARAGARVAARAASHGNGELSAYTYSPNTGTLTRALPKLSDALSDIPNGAGSGTAGSSPVAVTP